MSISKFSYLTCKKSLSALIYQFGKDFCYNKLILEMAQQNQDINNLSDLLDYIEKTEIPTFPLRGRDLIEQGIKENSNIGVILKRLEKEWIESGFILSRDELLKKAI